MRFRKKIHQSLVLLLASLALLILLAGCGYSSTGQSKQTTNTAQSTQTSQATLVLDLDVDRYEFNTPANMCHAPMLADVVASSTGQSHWNTTNHTQPSILSQAVPTPQKREALVKGNYMIYTPIQFTSMSILRDNRPAKQASEEFVIEGGQAGTTRITVGEYPHLQTATRYLVVFAPGINASTHQSTYQWQVVYNAFPIDAHNMVTLQQAGSPNEPGSGKPQPEVTISLSSLQQQLAACH